jgi:hypothetical protein
MENMDEWDSPTKDRVRSVIAGSKDSIPALPPMKKLQRITIPLPQHAFLLSIQVHCHNIPSYCQYNSTVTTYLHTVNTIPLSQHTFILSIQFHCHNTPALQVQSLFQRECSTECSLVLSLSISSTLQFS